MLLSYAQRLEDYHLDLAFAGQQTGFYIDIGAGHPVADNVSYWFYLKGWRGLVVEPQRALHSLYAHLRPRDIAVCRLIGRMNGEADFHLVDRMHGLSTIVPQNARTAVELGARVQTIPMTMQTLSSLVADYRIGAVDFLKIDVEGAEGDVIAGADWTAFRPRIVLVEAVSPGSMSDSWQSWEPILVGHGYKFALYDGLNRFYVAKEASDIAGRLPREPAPWDSAQHLYDFGRAHERIDHPDHALASQLVRGFLSALPSLDPELLIDLLSRHRDAASGSEPDRIAGLMRLLAGHSEPPGQQFAAGGKDNAKAELARLIRSDNFRAALGRIASAYDGGHIID